MIGSVRVGGAERLPDGRQFGDGGEHRTRRPQFRQDGEVLPGEGAVEVFGGHTAPPTEEGLEPLVAAVDGLEVELAAAALAGLAVEGLVGETQGSRTGREDRGAVGDQAGIRHWRSWTIRVCQPVRPLSRAPAEKARSPRSLEAV